jgi:hypothetical protein
MTALKVWWAKSKWAVWALLGLGAAIMLAVLYSLFNQKPKPRPGQPTQPGLPPVPKALQDKVDAAEEHALVTQVEARTQAADKKAELTEIAKLDDGAERRKRLAAMLTKL